MTRPLKSDQEQFDFVEMHVVTGEPRDVVRPNVGCGLGVTNLVPFGQSADRCRRLILMGSVHLSPSVFIITHIGRKSTKTLYLGSLVSADLGTPLSRLRAARRTPAASRGPIRRRCVGGSLHQAHHDLPGRSDKRLKQGKAAGRLRCNGIVDGGHLSRIRLY
jgi:hypothetical protein